MMDPTRSRRVARVPVLATLAVLASAALAPRAGQRIPGPTSLGAQEETSRSRRVVINEYCRRAAEASPLDPAEQYALGVWCRENGLGDQAQSAFRRVIALDPEHAEARGALGFVRYGDRWLRKGQDPAASRPRVKAPAAGAASGGDPSTATPAGSRPAATRPSASGSETSGSETSGSETSGSAPSTASEASPGSRAEQELARKKEWARQAEEVFRTSFLTIEDDDFLIHTTHSSRREGQVQAFLGELKRVRKDLLTLVGDRSRTSPWPGKVQFVLLRSAQEYERFADVVDKVKDAVNAEGAYTGAQGHTVLWKPDSVEVARRLGETVLDGWGGSDRWVAWWLEVGLAEFLAASEPSGQKVKLRERHIRYAARYIEAEAANLTIYTLLESPKNDPRDMERNRALAMTLVEFLIRAGRTTRLRALVKALKSDEAPPPPASEDGDPFKSFYLSYLAFQQETIESTYRTKLPRLEERWKQWVAQEGAKVNASSREAPRRTGGGRNRRT